MMKRITAIFLILLTFLSGCAQDTEPQSQNFKQYNATFLTLFDTVTTIVGRAPSEEVFQSQSQAIHDELLVYHQLFDIYHDYGGINNLKTINDNAGIQPVTVDQKIISLLLDCRKYYELTGGRVNVAMGSVLSLWHHARNAGINDPEHAQLPDTASLIEAANHVDFSCIVIDEDASTVYIRDPEMSLDVGAVAKGWAAQQVAVNAPAGLLISVGGNVCATGPKDESGTPWVVGIQDPDGGSDYLHTLYVKSGSVVTSGDYQRAYAVDGKLYHHIIDPATQFPSEYWRSVTVVCADSGLADALSTALFLLPQAEGQALLDNCDAEAMWVDASGNIFYSPGFTELIRT